MEAISLDYQFSTDVDQLKKFKCIEISKNKELAYIGFRLTSNKARKSCPVIIFDIQNLRVIGQIIGNI
jgi:hypothetical protein